MGISVSKLNRIKWSAHSCILGFFFNHQKFTHFNNDNSSSKNITSNITFTRNISSWVHSSRSLIFLENEILGNVQIAYFIFWHHMQNTTKLSFIWLVLNYFMYANAYIYEFYFLSVSVRPKIRFFFGNAINFSWPFENAVKPNCRRSTEYNSKFFSPCVLPLQLLDCLCNCSPIRTMHVCISMYASFIHIRCGCTLHSLYCLFVCWVDSKILHTIDVMCYKIHSIGQFFFSLFPVDHLMCVNWNMLALKSNLKESNWATVHS